MWEGQETEGREGEEGGGRMVKWFKGVKWVRGREEGTTGSRTFRRMIGGEEEDELCIKIIEFVCFVIAGITNEDTFDSTMRIFVMISMKDLFITETPIHMKMIIVWYFIKNNFKRWFVLEGVIEYIIDEINDGKNLIALKGKG